MLSRLVQKKNAVLPIVFTFLPKVTFLRLEHVSQIINDYLNGKIPSILELETQLLNVACLPEETNGKSLNFAGYCNMITANVSFS